MGWGLGNVSVVIDPSGVNYPASPGRVRVGRDRGYHLLERSSGGRPRYVLMTQSAHRQSRGYPAAIQDARASRGPIDRHSGWRGSERSSENAEAPPTRTSNSAKYQKQRHLAGHRPPNLVVLPYNDQRGLRRRMFERYTERARRVLFFARYEASQLGSISIETEHLLLGLIREGKGLTSRIFARSHLSLENIRKEIEGPHGLPREGVDVGRDSFQRRDQARAAVRGRRGRPAAAQLHRHRAPAARHPARRALGRRLHPDGKGDAAATRCAKTSSSC